MSEQHDDHEQTNDQDTKETLEAQETMGAQDSRLTLEAFYTNAKERIRYVIHEGEPWYTVVDVIGLLTDAPKPRTYWADMKRRIQDEGVC